MSTVPSEGFRTVGVDSRFPWPCKERVITFRGHEFHIIPGSEELSRMIRVKTDPRFTQINADKMILELLSALAWAEQAGAVTTFGNWCTVPLNIGKGPRGMSGPGLMKCCFMGVLFCEC